MKYASTDHRKYYAMWMKKSRNDDPCYKALFYTLAISPDVRTHISQVFDFENGMVKPEVLRQGWITSGSAKVIRLAFNLYTNGIPSSMYFTGEDEDDSEAMDEVRRYAPDEIFCCSYAPYFLEAICIRYPEYL